MFVKMSVQTSDIDQNQDSLEASVREELVRFCINFRLCQLLCYFLIIVNVLIDDISLLLLYNTVYT